ncbi:unnamed protein product [Anisakis simplex]|uniref:Uncharacterized protein n=1 Tax=Anisakis simplex TaxID=6269 RepID=A0A3P6TAG8_ANISI|nr:unnamed protein product [Anisakis simplex]
MKSDQKHPPALRSQHQGNLSSNGWHEDRL